MESSPFAGPVEVVLVRHGESVRNHASDLAHRGDPSLLERQMREESDESAWPLTDLGHRQATVAGEWIREHLGASFDAAFVSPYVRTRQTADGLSLGLDWRIDDRLREREWGEYLADGDSYSAEQYLSDLNQCGQIDWKSRFLGAESVLDMAPRVEDFLRQALSETPKGRIIAVTHGGTIRAVQTIFERLCAGPDCPDHRLSNCCVVIYRLETLDLVRWNWEGKVRTAHPVISGAPETDWQPIP